MDNQNINEKITGLTQKAIRLYEDRGLICVTRDDNGYRNYSDEDVETLKRIKLFRSIGVSVADIKLCLCGVISVDELMDKRKAEILKESGRNSESYRICEAILNKADPDSLKGAEIFTEGDKSTLTTHGALAVGVDIGTTTVSAVVYDLDNKEEIEAYSLPHNSYIFSDIRSEQSVSIIMEKSEKLLYHILETYQGIVSIGLSGQMHGIVYVDADGNSVSSLINWQDKRADQPTANGKTTCDLSSCPAKDKSKTTTKIAMLKINEDILIIFLRFALRFSRCLWLNSFVK